MADIALSATVLYCSFGVTNIADRSGLNSAYLDEDVLTSSAEAARNRPRGDGDEPDPGRGDGNDEGV